MEMMKFGTHALQEVNSKSELANLKHEDTITIKDLDDAYAAATNELITGVDEAHLRLCSY